MEKKLHCHLAIEATSIHAALKELRLSLYMTQAQFSEALKPYLPSGRAPTNVAICIWETESGTFSRSALPSRNTFRGTDAITAYGEVFRERGMGDWFDAHAEKFRELLRDAKLNSKKIDSAALSMPRSGKVLTK